MLKRLSLVLSFALLSTHYASADNSKAQEAAIDYRQSTFKMVKWHIGPMAGMVKGKIDYDASAFSEHAEAIFDLSKLASNGFLVESVAENSRAKAAIWKDKAEFDKKLESFTDAAEKLLAAAKSNDMSTIKPAFGALGQSCKGCHNDYRSE